MYFLLQTNKPNLMKKLVIIYETKEGKEIHRDWNNLYVPKETDLVSFKNIDSPNILGKTKEDFKIHPPY